MTFTLDRRGRLVKIRVTSLSGQVVQYELATQSWRVVEDLAIKPMGHYAGNRRLDRALRAAMGLCGCELLGQLKLLNRNLLQFDLKLR